MMAALLVALLGLASVGSAQKVANAAEKNPAFTTKRCTSTGCVTRNVFLTLDIGNRNITSTADPTKFCPPWTTADTLPQLQSICNSTADCASTCVVQPVDYNGAGVVLDSPSSFGLKLFGPNASGIVVAQKPKVFILDESGEKYDLLKLGTELTFDVDLSTIPCGAVAGVIAVEMDPEGGKTPMNPGGAKFGTGYCDGQCDPQYIFANFNNSGACCTQLDIYHANTRANHAAPHPCNPPGPTLCSTADGTCKGQANEICDPHGCAADPYRQGATKFYGYGKDFTVDTSRPFTVVTQFLGGPGSAWSGMKRMYIQDGKLIDNFADNGTTTPTVITPDYCSARLAGQGNGTVLGNFTKLGGLDAVAKSLSRGLTVHWNIWGGDGGGTWLDAGDAGPCNATTDTVAGMLAASPDAIIKFSDVRTGDIGTTYTDKVAKST